MLPSQSVEPPGSVVTSDLLVLTGMCQLIAVLTEVGTILLTIDVSGVLADAADREIVLSLEVFYFNATNDNVGQGCEFGLMD